MATTRLMPLHVGKGRTVAEALGWTTDYVKNLEKTDGGELVSAYHHSGDYYIGVFTDTAELENVLDALRNIK